MQNINRKFKTKSELFGAHEFDITFDFSNVSESEIMEQALKSLTITYQQQFRQSQDREKALAMTSGIVPVKDLIQGRRPRVSKAEKAEKAIETLSPEEKAALLEKLMQSMK
jgi:hypothetical protein